MNTIFSKKFLPVVVLNVSTILIVAIMLVVSQVSAKSNQSNTASMLNAGVLSYQGTLMDSGGNPQTGTFEFTFKIYDAPSSGTLLWEEARLGANAVPVQNGLFNVMLGSLNPIPETVWEQAELFLGVKIGSDAEMSPREKLTFVPGAYVAQMALSVPDDSISGEHIINGSITQSDAPTLLRSANGQNEIIQSGNNVFANGSDGTGAIVISYPCFPNSARAFLALNGHYAANHSVVIGNNGVGLCATTIIVSPPTTNPIRINWIAIGN